MTTINDKILVQYKATKLVNGGAEKLTVAAKLYSLGNQKPYFAVTGELYEKRRGRWFEIACGCLHDEIREHFPNLQPVIDLHLSDEDGVPMHAVANAQYWAGCCGSYSLTRVGLAKSIVANTLERYDVAPEKIAASIEAAGLNDGPEKVWQRHDGTPNPVNLAKHLRIGTSTAEAICKAVVDGTMSNEDTVDYVNTLRPRWKQEADDAKELLADLLARSTSAVISKE